MSRSREERIRDVRRLLVCARAVHSRRTTLAPAIAEASGLSPAGVELGFASLEREATDSELHALLTAAGEAPRVHVVLSANVFVAPLRAIALARAAAEKVTVRPSPRDPVLTRALVAEAVAAGDEGLSLVDERRPQTFPAGEVHVYGRDATVAAVRAAVQPGVVVRGHGAGMGIAVVSGRAERGEAADALALDVVAFDQRGCLSPRLALVVGSQAHAEEFAEALHSSLGLLGSQVPRGRLLPEERAEFRRWRETHAFAGKVWQGPDHAVVLAPPGAPLQLPPAGRHLAVLSVASLGRLPATIAPIERFIVAVGTDDLDRVASVAPRHARVSHLGMMQRPPLDGPVDRRSP